MVAELVQGEGSTDGPWCGLADVWLRAAAAAAVAAAAVAVVVAVVVMVAVEVEVA